MSGEMWVVGGEQRVSFAGSPEWHRYETALVVRVAGGRAERVLEYRSPREHSPDWNPSHTFKAATLSGDTAYLCTQTEVLLCDFPSFRIRQVISHPCFNDLHHVTPGPDGTLWVAVTGLDAVARLSAAGEILELAGTLGQDPWERFSPDVDYRKVATTKPHRSHPNHLFFLDGRPWVTRFEQRDAIPLHGDDAPFALGAAGAGVHDGHLAGDHLYFTAVNGRVVRFHLGDRRGRGGGRGRQAECFDVHSLTRQDGGPIGWCRGLLPLGPSAWVGFSRIRYTTLRQNLSWLRHGFRSGAYHAQRPTRIALYDLDRPRLREEIDLEAAGMGAVFSIHGAPDPGWTH
ncbi:MAG TPA: hypothetical protein VGR07_17505 [Thermoanaerobaculia bacterium]|nr:hypothetical protein [Thermoanaerobaculia bacterium]